ncbi:MAG: carbon-nitrogen hydrolase family protein [Fimbriimonadaceae bacterium]
MRLACVQSDVVFGDISANAEVICLSLGGYKKQGVDLVMYPEAFLTGYCYDSEEHALEAALPISGSENDLRWDKPVVDFITESVNKNDIMVVVGTIAKDERRLRNIAMLFEPGKPVRAYYKCHLPYMGVDRFVVPGDNIPVFDTRLGKIGMNICFDLRHPEPFRIMGMRGADLILLPTNWPDAPHTERDALCRARAVENKVFFASCNRTGDENGFEFRGRSGIYDFEGRELATAGTEDEVIIADLDLALSREKDNRCSGDGSHHYL